MALQKAHFDQVSVINKWVLQGRIALQAPDDAWIASLNWSQSADSFILRVFGPLGMGVYELRGTPLQVVMQTPDHQTIQAQDPESLMLKTLGWSLPLKGLRYWIRGIPYPQSEINTIQYDDSGRVSKLNQLGWNIEIQSYEENVKPSMPSKLNLFTDKIKVRLKVINWNLT